MTGRVVRVVPDVSGIDKEFDYRLPPELVPAAAESISSVGWLVRIELHGRRVPGWIVAEGVRPPDGVVLRDIVKVSSLGPTPELVDLSTWAARRWAGKRSALLKSSSPDTMVAALPAGPERLHLPPADEALLSAMKQPGVTVLQSPPADDLYAVVLAAAHLGDALIMGPGIGLARHLGGRLRRDGGRVALAGRDWALGAAGGVVIGARRAAWAPTRSLAVVVVLDEHDERLQEERNPTWHGRDVAIERARRAGVGCVLVSASPSPAAIDAADRVLRPSRSDERRAWPNVTVVDRRQGDGSDRGLFSHELARAARATSGRVVCVLNRKGRAQMLACATCGELVRTNDGNALMSEVDGTLIGPGGEERPKICLACAGTKLKRLRLGVSRAAEELASLVGESVIEVTAQTDDVGSHRVLVGTEAVLHRVPDAAVVAFLDFDQELLTPRYRAGEQAMALLIKGATLVARRATSPGGSRADGMVLVQTRSPDHRVIRAVQGADPRVFVEAELEQRRLTAMPPFSAVAEVSGAGAAEMVGAMGGGLGAEVLGPNETGRYLVRAPDADSLADVLASTPRPKARVRVAVDPPRI